MGSHQWPKIAVELLLRAGADVIAANQSSTNFDDTKKIPMARALDTNDMKLCTALYNSGVFMDAKTSATYKSRLMFEYVKRNDTEAVSCLLSAGAQVNEIHEEFPDTALGMLEAVLHDNGDVILASGVFANDKDLAIFVFKNGGKWGRCAYEELLKTRVEKAIKNRDLESLQRMHMAGVRPRPGMIMSIGSLQTARYLDEATLLSEILIQNGDEILVSAILAENEPLVAFLLEKEADQNASNYLEYEIKVRSCQTPLEASLIQMNLQLAQVLISRGALITQREIMAAAWEALRRGDDSIMGRFLDMFPPSFYAAPGAIGLAIQLRKFDLTHLILRSGIDPRGELSLSERLRCKVSHHLSESGWWCVEDQTEPSETALDIAVIAGNRATLQMLLMSAVWTKEARGRAFTLSMQCKRMDLVQDLWTSDTDVNQELGESYGSNSTPLKISIEWGDVPLMSRLIAAGANIDQLGTHGRYTPLQQATSDDKREIVESLIAAGANVNSPPNPRKGATALQLAVKQGNVELMELLLENGAEVNQAPAYQAGATALQFAAIQGYIGIVRKLLEAGAAIHAPRSRIYGRTATEGAAEHGRIDVLQLFLNEEVSFEGDFRTEYIRSVKLAEKNGHRAAANLINSKICWTIWDREQLQDETFDYGETQVLQLNIL